MSILSNFNINCEWGLNGIKNYVQSSDVIIIVDVLSFSTAVDIACDNGAIVHPYPLNDDSAGEYAQRNNAVLAKSRSRNELSLSPYSLLNIPADTRLVLPSPNGASLSLATGETMTLCGCLRNFRSVAEYAMNHGEKITVIPAGERWKDGSIRFALEDLFGAGAIISCLTGTRSPESELAVNVYASLHNIETDTLKNCTSGIELIERGFEVDVYLAADMNVSTCIPFLKDGAYINVNPSKK